MSSYAPLQHAIWEDDDFRGLTPDAKLVYVLLLSHRKLSRCGVLDLMPSRWAKATGLTPEALHAALDGLSAARFVLIDHDTEELAVRTKVKNDQPGTWTQVKSVWRSWEQVESPVLRDFLIGSFPDVCWEHPDKAPAPYDRPSDTPCDTPSDGATDDPWRVTAPSTLHPHPAPLADRSSSVTAGAPSTGSDDDPIGAAIAILAEGDLARRTGALGPVGNVAGWTNAARQARRRDHAATLHRLHREHPDWSPAVLAASILDLEQPSPDTPADSTVAAQAAAMDRNARRAAGDVCQACEDTGWVPDDIGTGVHPCTCAAGAFAG